MAKKPNPKSQKEQKIITQVMEINQLISNMIYRDAVFGAFIKDYDKGANKTHSLGDTVLAIIDKVQSKVGQLDPPMLFAVGNIALQNLTDDIANTGRPPVKQDEFLKIVQYVMQTYLSTHKDELDVVEVGNQLKQLQMQLANGEFAKKMSQRTGLNSNDIDAAINGKSSAPRGFLDSVGG